MHRIRLRGQREGSDLEPELLLACFRDGETGVGVWVLQPPPHLTSFLRISDISCLEKTHRGLPRPPGSKRGSSYVVVGGVPKTLLRSQFSKSKVAAYIRALKNSEDPSPPAVVPLGVTGTSLTQLSAHPGGGRDG